MSEGVENIIFRRQILPDTNKNRTRQKMYPGYITIHEVSLGTARTSGCYNMEHYKEQIFNQPESRKYVGYHFLVSDEEIYQFIPDDERANHTGTYDGNNYSIGIERIVNEDTDFEKAINVQAKLAATLMKKYGIPIMRVVPHCYWREDTTCPSRMMNGQYGGWKYFINRVAIYFQIREFYDEILEDKKQE